MNGLKKWLAYPLIGLGLLFVVAGITAPFDTERSSAERRDALLGCFMIGGLLAAPGGALLWSSRGQQRAAKTLALATEHERLQNVLYQLIEAEDGRFTLVQFAIAANIPATEAKTFLTEQATAFNANFDVSQQGSVVYRFPVS